MESNLINPDPVMVQQLLGDAMLHAKAAISRDSKDAANVLTADDDPILGPLLRSHLFTEQTFGRIFATAFQNAESLDKVRLSFAQKLAIVGGFGRVPGDAIECMRRVNALRNRCAHRHGYLISKSDIDNIGQSLGTTYRDLKQLHGADLKVLASFTFTKAFEPFLLAAIIGEAIAKVTNTHTASNSAANGGSV